MLVLTEVRTLWELVQMHNSAFIHVDECDIGQSKCVRAGES